MANYTAQSAVTSAWYKASYDRNLQPTISGGDMLFGLEQMQFVLDGWRNKIPYPERYIFNSQEELINTPFVWVDTVACIFPGGKVKYLMADAGLRKFEENNSVIGLQGPPQIYWFDQLSQSINVYPNSANLGYTFQVYGRPAMVVGSLNVPMPTNMPTYMYQALLYELAFIFCGDKGIEFDEKKNEQRLKLVAALEEKREVYISSPAGTEMTYETPSVPPYPAWGILSGLPPS